MSNAEDNVKEFLQGDTADLVTSLDNLDVALFHKSPVIRIIGRMLASKMYNDYEEFMKSEVNRDDVEVGDLVLAYATFLGIITQELIENMAKPKTSARLKTALTINAASVRQTIMGLVFTETKDRELAKKVGDKIAAVSFKLFEDLIAAFSNDVAKTKKEPTNE